MKRRRGYKKDEKETISSAQHMPCVGRKWNQQILKCYLQRERSGTKEDRETTYLLSNALHRRHLVEGEDDRSTDPQKIDKE